MDTQAHAGPVYSNPRLSANLSVYVCIRRNQEALQSAQQARDVVMKEKAGLVDEINELVVQVGQLKRQRAGDSGKEG